MADRCDAQFSKVVSGQLGQHAGVDGVLAKRPLVLRQPKPLQPLSDVDYIRRITFNVALVAQVSQTGLILAQPLPGGAPAAAAKVQTVCGFIDRTGGSFYQEWSGLFVMV